MGSLIKTGEVVKADPRDIIYFYRFIREYITWDLKDYFNFLDKMGKKDSPYYRTDLVLNSMLIPKFKYTSFHNGIKGVKVEQADKIKYENFSHFDVYKFDPNSEGEILKIRFALELRHSNVRRVARVCVLDFVVSMIRSDTLPSVTSVDFPYSGMYIHETNVDIEEFQRYLKTLRWTQGKSYLELSKHSIPNEKGVVYKIRHFEEYFFLFVNFLYTLYAGSFEKNNETSVLFEPFTELLKTYGNTFEEMLSTVKEVMMFVG
jgi:hypothetical protein